MLIVSRLCFSISLSVQGRQAHPARLISTLAPGAECSNPLMSDAPPLVARSIEPMRPQPRDLSGVRRRSVAISVNESQRPGGGDPEPLSHFPRRVLFQVSIMAIHPFTSMVPSTATSAVR
jgi:hypothetical protein